jgi:transposase
MSRFLPYSPEQASLLPRHVRDVLSPGHLCFFVHEVVEAADLRRFEEAYSEEGAPAYAPAMMLKLLLYAYAVGITSMRRLEQRVREDLPLRFLAGGAEPDFWALNSFRRRHAENMVALFTQVVELARRRGMGRLGKVAIDSTRVRANASRQRVHTEEQLRTQLAETERAVRRWQRRCAQSDPNENGGTEVVAVRREELVAQMRETAAQLERLRQGGQTRQSRTDPDARFLQQRGRAELAYTAEVAVSDDHLIVASRVTQAAADNHSLLPMVEEVERVCGRRPQRVLADAGYFSLAAVEEAERRGIDLYVPDSNLARELNRGQRCPARPAARHPAQRRMRQKLRTRAGRATYLRRKALAEPVMGVLKEQRGMRQFRCRGLRRVAVEWMLAAIAYNLTRMWRAA